MPNLEMTTNLSLDLSVLFWGSKIVARLHLKELKPVLSDIIMEFQSTLLMVDKY